MIFVVIIVIFYFMLAILAGAVVVALLPIIIPIAVIGGLVRGFREGRARKIERIQRRIHQ